jgi:transcription elongation factor GreA
VSKEYLMTREGLLKLETELENLKIVRRKEVAEKIKEALSFGDISENAEYDEAKNEQAELEKRIAKLENMVRNAILIDESLITTDEINVGCRVKLLEVEENEEMEYMIVGAAEADPFDQKISNESPVGRALIGCRVGETIEVTVPDGVIKYQVLAIER